MVDPRRAVGGIQEHVEGRGVGQRAVGERGDLGVQLGEDPRHLVLEMPESAPRALTGSSTLRVEVPCR
jgi:hypothetical protein